MGKGPRVDCSKDELLTQQSGKEDADINNIVERAKRGAILPVSEKSPIYGDFTVIPRDLRECLLIVKHAEDVFQSLDAKVRFRFDNDPAKMLDFLNDVKNRDEAIKLGMVSAPPEPPLKADSVVEPKAPKSKPSASDVA